MKKYAYIVFYLGKAIAGGTLAADRETSAASRLRKIYGAKKQGFSWVLHEMM